jgi:hypothetical protein
MSVPATGVGLGVVHNVVMEREGVRKMVVGSGVV